MNERPAVTDRNYRDLVENLRDVVVELDRDGRVAYLNPAWQEHLGHPVEASVGRPLVDFIPEWHRDTPAELLPPTCGNGHAELPLTHADGRTVWFETRLSEVGTGLRVGVLHNIDARRGVEHRLREQKAEARLLALVASRTHNLVIITDPDGRIVWVNESFTRLTGYSLAEVAGRKPGHVLQGPGTDQPTVAVMREKVRAGQPFCVEIMNYTKSGTPYWLEIEVQPVRDAAGAITQFIAVEQDITSRKRDAEQLRESEARQRAAMEAAEAAYLAKSQFLANMSHEVRTPMAAIVGYADILLDPRLDVDRQSKYLHGIRRNGEHLLRLINDVLDLSKIESGGMVLEHVPCRLWRVIEGALAVAEVRANEKHLHLIATPVGRVPRAVTTDPTRLTQILFNLLDNAVKFTDAGKTVEIRVRLDLGTGGPRLWLEVEDQGCGMTPAELARLFRPFVQADPSTTRKYGGTGLGLSIVKRLAEGFGGTVTVRSTQGVGSCFTVEMPIDPADQLDLVDGEELMRESKIRYPACESARTLSGRVLLAEDNPDNRNIIRYLLERAGLTVETAENGRVAVEKASAAGFDLILMDMQMPELDGYAATSALRQKGYERAVVALTAHAMPGDEEKCLRAGCNAYLTKPVDPDHLLRVVAKYLRSRSWVLKYGDVRRAAPSELPLDEPEGLAELLTAFRQSLPEKVHELASALAAGDHAKVGRLAHGLKGAAGMYELPAVSESAGLLEEACREGQDQVLLSELIAELDGQAAAAAAGQPTGRA